MANPFKKDIEAMSDREVQNQILMYQVKNNDKLSNISKILTFFLVLFFLGLGVFMSGIASLYK
jgi:hypothetical protein